jgi:UDP-N-acetylmuramate dehydrogenase
MISDLKFKVLNFRSKVAVSQAESKLNLKGRDAIVEEIAARLGVRAERGRRFAELTSLRVGGAIDWVISPETEEQAAATVYELEKADILWRALGSGSNVLADDAEHHYVVLSLKGLKGEAVFDGERVSVSAGYSLPRLCIDAGRRGLSGIEGLGGIPGTVGGALWMNAGAYGHEIGTVTEAVRVAREGNVVEIPGSAIEWNYRHTSFREGELLLGCTLRLRRDDPEKIRQRMGEAKNKRLATQPHGARSAGCFFKNPPGSAVGTGKIIDEMGMKGTRRGGAQVSPVHANFIVTEGENAQAADALALAEEIRERVRREHGIELEYEVELWRAAAPEESQESEVESLESKEEQATASELQTPDSRLSNPDPKLQSGKKEEKA